MFWTRLNVVLCVCVIARTQVIPGKSRTNDGDYNSVNTDGSFDFGYANKDQGSSYHVAHGSSGRVVGGRFGARDPATGAVKETVYTAGPRGFRAKGPNVHRKIDLDQRPRGPIGNKDDPYFDPNEDPSYSFNFDTRTYSKNEDADSRGDVKGHYTYVDDVGERHDVSYIAGRDTGFHVTSALPDAPNIIGNPFHRSPLVRGESKSRGRTAVQRGLDGSYRFISAGPDQRRTESSDSHGNVRGSYTFLDDKGVQRTVHYIAGPGIGYRIVKNSNDPFIPPYFPTIPSPYDPSFANAGPKGYSPKSAASEDVFKAPDATAASGHVKPKPFPTDKDTTSPKPNSISSSGSSEESPPDSVYSDLSSKGSSSRNSAEDIGYVDEEISSYGIETKPTIGPGKPSRYHFKTYRTTKKPYVPLKPSHTSSSRRKGQTDVFESKKNIKTTPHFNIGLKLKHTEPDATIIRNVGEDYFGVPPGVSVRAHVQSIDLYPFGSKPISPSEAFEKDKL